MIDLHIPGPNAKSPRAINPTRRSALGGMAAALGSFTVGGASATDDSRPMTIPPRPKSNSYEVLEVGPGKRFKSLTEAGCFMNSEERWSGGYAPPGLISEMGFRVIISPGPPGYYTNDSGSHSRRWPSMVGWPFYEGLLIGPTIIEGEEGKPYPVLDTDGFGDGVLYYQTGLFATGSLDATFRRLIFKGFRRQDGNGNYAAVRLGQTFADIPMNSHVLFEDCEFSHCDNGIMGGSVGQSLTLRRCYFHDNGNETGSVHNVYFSSGDVLTVEDSLSTRCTIGHLLKSRAAKTIIRKSRLLGDNGTESACLDVPDGGDLDIEDLVCEKSPYTDANWLIHYCGENEDDSLKDGGTPFHANSKVKIRNLTMKAPPKMLRHPDWGEIIGIEPQKIGLPCEILSEPPLIDRSPPKEIASLPAIFTLEAGSVKSF